jgi:hypothetical protein
MMAVKMQQRNSTLTDLANLLKQQHAAKVDFVAPLKDAKATIEYVGKKLQFSEEATDNILNHFILGGQMTAGGVMQAVTSYAQVVENPNVAFDLESKALDALALAASK